MDPFDYHETTISYDPQEALVHVYTTCGEVYASFASRGVKPVRSKALQPGYELVYRASDCRDPASLLF
jgi:hypothetical protein